MAEYTGEVTTTTVVRSTDAAGASNSYLTLVSPESGMVVLPMTAEDVERFALGSTVKITIEEVV